MNSSSPRHDPAVDEQAAYWAARLDGGTLEASDRATLDAWLAQSPAHRAALADYCQFSADLEEQLPALVSAGAVKMPVTESPRRRWFTLPRLTLVTFAAAAAIALGVFVTRPATNLENFASAIAQRATHTLADGTRVELNAHTSLRFENTPTERRVRLAGGEALFSVAKDFTRPFLIETPHGSVRVTGTTFSVRNDPASSTTLEVTVVEGSVEVRPSDSTTSAPYALTASQQLSAGPGREVSVRALDAATLDNALAWREGRLVCAGMSLAEVAARFARYHGKRIEVHSSVAQLSVGAVYSLDDLNGFLRGLETALPVKASYDLSGVVSINPSR